jgi:hypothetical protein
MRSRERWLAAIRFQPLDHLPFWPKLDPAYPRFRQAPFSSMDVTAIHRWMGTDPHLWIPEVFKENTHKNRAIRSTHGSLTITRFEIGSATLEQVLNFDEDSQAFHPVSYPIRTADDIELMTEYYRNLTVEPDPAALEIARALVESNGGEYVSGTAVGESPLMYFLEWLAGIQNAQYLLQDHPTECAGLFAAMHGVLTRKMEISAELNPADILYLIENTSTTLISPRQYRAFSTLHLQAYGAITRQAGRILILHMCGHLKQLLPDLSTLPVEGFEAFTSPTVGNTTLGDGRRECPDKCLIGGTNAVLWLQPASKIITTLEQDLDALPHTRGIVITSGGVMPPFCEPGTIKEVRTWLNAYPTRP